MIAGVGKHTPTSTNECGGKQSDLPYRCDLLDGPAILTLSRILKEGADKYDVDNWRHISDRSHVNHALTHLMAYLHGDPQDEHLAHAFCRLMFAVALESDKEKEPSLGNAKENPAPPVGSFNPGLYTYSGRWINPAAPQRTQFCVEDIAHGLANTCRFSGQCRSFYSVAEHSIWVSRLVGPTAAKWGLFHDASEAYLADVPVPVKQLCPDYQRVEKRFMETIASQFNLSSDGPPPVIHMVDHNLVIDEMRWLFDHRPDTEMVRLKDFGRTSPLTPDHAEALFLQRFVELWDD